MASPSIFEKPNSGVLAVASSKMVIRPLMAARHAGSLKCSIPVRTRLAKVTRERRRHEQHDPRSRGRGLDAGQRVTLKGEVE